AKLPPVVRLDDARQAVNTESSPAKSRFCHVAKHAEARRSRIGLLANDRSLSRQLAFAADALAASQSIVSMLVARKTPRQVPLPMPNLVGLAELGPNLLLAAHA